MSSIRASLSDIDFTLLGAAFILVVIGVFSVYSSGMSAEGALISREYLKQILWALTGLVILAFFAILDYRRLKDYSFYLYAFFIVLLVFTRLFGRVVHGARSWIGIGDVGIQPSEFCKIATILFLAQYLSDSEHERGFVRLAKSSAIIGLPLLLILSQPDFGTALVFFPIFLFMIFMAGIDRRYLLFLLAAGFGSIALTVLPLWERFVRVSSTRGLFVLYQTPYSYYVMIVTAIILGLSVWGWKSFKKKYYFWMAYAALILLSALVTSYFAQRVLKEYQIKRLIVFLDPRIDPLDSGWNILNSVMAIGSGGFAGKGFLQGTQSQYRFLPQPSTDFIFAVIAEEWGFLGGFFVFALFYVIMRRCIAIIKASKDSYAVCIISGLMGMIFFHFIVNVGMAMGIMPITGIPLFFLSYGGSSLWAVLSAIGLMLSISARRYSV